MIRSGFVCLRLTPLCMTCVAAALLFAAQPVAQAPQGVLWDSYETAAGLLARAGEAHGGAATIRGLTLLSFRWQGEDYAPTQGRVPGWDTEGNAGAPSSTFGWISREAATSGIGSFTSQAAISTRSGRSETAASSSSTICTRSAANATAAARGTLAQASASIPVLHLRAALARPTTLRHLGEVRTEGAREEIISYTTPEGDAVTLYFDAATHLLTRRERIGLGSLGDEVNTFAYSDYRTVAGFALPHVMKVHWNGHLAGRHRLIEFSAKADLPEPLFEAPEGYVAATAAPAPAVVPVADGVAFMENLGAGTAFLWSTPMRASWSWMRRCRHR